MGQHETYCSICGGPLNGAVGIVNDWNEHVLLLTVGKPNESGIMEAFAYDLDLEPPSGLQLMRIEADFVWGSGHQFGGWVRGEHRYFLALYVPFDENDEPSNPLYIPVHGRCMAIADELIAQRKSSHDTVPDDAIVDEWSLWQVFSSRYNAGPFSLPDRTAGGCLREPNDYMGGKECRQMNWEKVADFEILEADPCNPTAIELIANGCSDEAVSKVPLQILLNLQNRRRIWSLLERARIGDIEPEVPGYLQS